ncbi:HAD family hydrolase [Lentibacillus saliphilus]|uniref:HAD family hydrolase n=1 Tax=Lentibacillus saliphilus TaxID=2737028 RepID=UPI001C30F919|nr:HAD family hydrolase [Lentibacillus saliphilus]
MAVVTVDFDGTLFQGNSFKIMFQAAKKDFTIKEWGIVAKGLLKATVQGMLKGKQAFKHGFFKAFARSFKGKTKEELTIFFHQLVQMGKDNVHHELVETIHEHQKKGDTIIILSGALRPFLDAFIASLGLKQVTAVGTDLKYDETGVCTGELDQIVNGTVKVDKVKAWLSNVESDSDQGISDREEPEIWAYADSMSDVPLLQFAHHPIVVNPNDDMRHVAQEHGWPIFAESV